jgi:predicted glycosyltransferase
MQPKKRILVCPLDWGLGHATRCIPVIQLLLQKNAEVLIAGSGRSLALLKLEFPVLTFIDLPGYDIRYSSGSLGLQIFRSIPRILKGIRREHQALENIVQEKNIDLVISDSRFGLWSTQVKTVFITHQLLIKAPVGKRLLHRINLRYVNRFTECWIPDVTGPTNLSGDLSHQYPLPSHAFFVGILSRFCTNTSFSSAHALKKTYDLLCIVSGPEPQRSIFEKMISKEVESSALSILIVRGITEEKQKIETTTTVDRVSHLNAAEMQAAIQAANIVISRSGYSTIMDLATLKKKAIFIPTPGQTEQEYLAELCMQKKIAYSEAQAHFNLKRALTKTSFYKGFEADNDKEKNVLEDRVDFLLNDG